MRTPRRLLALFASLALVAISAPVAALAQSAPQPITFSLSAAGQSSPVLPLAGCSTGSVVVANSGTGQTLVPQATSDTQANITAQAAQWTTVTTIGAGSITTFGTYTGNVANTAVTGLRVTLTALASGGPVTGSIACTSGIGGITTTPSGTQTITGTVQPGNTQNTTSWLVGGGITITQLTSASTTTCTNIRASAGRVWSVTNSGPATTVFPAFYNDVGTTCASATAFLGDATSVTFGTGSIYPWTGGMPVAGVAYKISGALTAGQNITVITGPL